MRRAALQILAASLAACALAVPVALRPIFDPSWNAAKLSVRATAFAREAGSSAAPPLCLAAEATEHPLVMALLPKARAIEAAP